LKSKDVSILFSDKRKIVLPFMKHKIVGKKISFSEISGIFFKKIQEKMSKSQCLFNANCFCEIVVFTGIPKQ